MAIDKESRSYVLESSATHKCKLCVCVTSHVPIFSRLGKLQEREQPQQPKVIPPHGSRQLPTYRRLISLSANSRGCPWDIPGYNAASRLSAHYRVARGSGGRDPSCSTTTLPRCMDLIRVIAGPFEAEDQGYLLTALGVT